MADHAMVRPHRTVLDVPRPVQHLEGAGHPEPALVEGVTELGRLVDRGEVGADHPARAQRHLGVGDHPPRLGEVEHDAVEAPLLDAVVDVTQLHPVVGVVSHHGGHVVVGPVGEVLAKLVADDGRAGAEQGHRERARTHPRLEHPHPRRDVGLHQDGGEVLRVDDLRPPRHLEDHVRQGRPHDQEPPPRAAEDGGSLVGPDEVVVGHEPDVGVEGRVGPQRQQVAPLLGVDQQHLLAGPQEAPVGLVRSGVPRGPGSPGGVHGAQEPVSDRSGGPDRMIRRSPGCSLVR